MGKRVSLLPSKFNRSNIAQYLTKKIHVQFFNCNNVNQIHPFYYFYNFSLKEDYVRYKGTIKLLSATSSKNPYFKVTGKNHAIDVVFLKPLSAEMKENLIVSYYELF